MSFCHSILKTSQHPYDNSKQLTQEKNMDLLNHFNGISLAIIMVLSYCAVLKNTQRDQSFKGAIKSLLNF